MVALESFVGFAIYTGFDFGKSVYLCSKIQEITINFYVFYASNINTSLSNLFLQLSIVSIIPEYCLCPTTLTR